MAPERGLITVQSLECTADQTWRAAETGVPSRRMHPQPDRWLSCAQEVTCRSLCSRSPLCLHCSYSSNGRSAPPYPKKPYAPPSRPCAMLAAPHPSYLFAVTPSQWRWHGELSKGRFVFTDGSANKSWRWRFGIGWRRQSRRQFHRQYTSLCRPRSSIANRLKVFGAAQSRRTMRSLRA